MISHVLFLKIMTLEKQGKFLGFFYPFLRLEYTHSSLFWFSTGAVQKGNRGVLAWLLGQQIHVQGKCHEDSRLHG